MLRYITTSIILLVGITSASLAQQASGTIPSWEERNLLLAEHLWLTTNNVAGLARYSTFIGGTTSLSYDRTNRDYHRAQEGNKLSALRFSSNRYDKLGKYFVVQGSFKFDMESEYERAWSDMIQTYNYQPYMYGSMRKGRYDTQNFDLHAKLSTIELGRFTFGTSIDYKASDMARLIDPRPRIQLAHYGITPALTYRVAAKHVVGLSGGYHYRKEKPKGFTIVNKDVSYDYVFFSGLENAQIVQNGTGSFKREFISDIFSGDFQYAYTDSKLRVLLTAGYSFEDQSIKGEKNESPGNFKQEAYNAGLHASLNTPSLLQTLSVKAETREGKSDEYLQELTSVKDPVTLEIAKEWKTIFTFESRYQLETEDASLAYKLYFKANAANDYKAHIGVSAKYSSFVNKHNLPDSKLEVSTVKAGVDGGYRLISKNNRVLWLNVAGAYHEPTSVEMLLANPTAPVAVNVLIPDQHFYRSPYYSANVDLFYSFPIKLRKSSIASFVKVYGGYLKSKDAGDLSSVGVSIGILTK